MKLTDRFAFCFSKLHAAARSTSTRPSEHILAVTTLESIRAQPRAALSDLNGHTARREHTGSSRRDRGEKWFDTDDVHHAREVVGEFSAWQTDARRFRGAHAWLAGSDQLTEMERIIDAEKSDIFDVLAYVAYAMSTFTREKRAPNARQVIGTNFNTKQQQFSI